MRKASAVCQKDNYLLCASMRKMVASWDIIDAGGGKQADKVVWVAASVFHGGSLTISGILSLFELSDEGDRLSLVVTQFRWKKNIRVGKS